MSDCMPTLSNLPTELSLPDALSTPADSYALTLSYKGSEFSGFARQKDASILTVQETLEQALATALRLEQPLLTVCAGRTDAGVHALEQVVSFELPAGMFSASGKAGTEKTGQAERCAQIVRSLNALTPESIRVLALRPARLGFSARFDALSREYRYYISNQAAPPIFTKDFAWHLPQKLDKDLMKRATIYLRGEHDFRSFCTAASAPPEKNTIRTISQIEIFEQQFFGEELLTVQIIGNAFLHSMVRIIVGTIQEVAAGKRDSEDLKSILSARKREAAGMTAPAQGLTLYKVQYPQGSFLNKNM